MTHDLDYLKMSTPVDLLYEACKDGDVNKLRRAIANGVDPKEVVFRELSDETPLHVACR